jgi:radical SAM superfamily enzyme YgiQ (UPF0313 family)
MKILLVSPHPYVKINLFSRFTYPCLTLQQIAGITPKEHSVKIIDERFERINFNKYYDLVGISSLTYNSLRGYEIADIFRKMNTKVVFGGYHASLLPEETIKHADSVVIGEAESTWPQLLKDVENNKLKQFYKAKEPVSPEQIPPARHDIGVYTPFAEAIQASRGCPTGCEFCAMQKIEGSKFRGRPIENIANEINSIKAKTIFFADASLTINPKYSKSLFAELKHFNKKFECFGNINVLSRDDEFLKLANDAGVTKWYVGIESISQENINAVGKGTNKVENYAKAIQKIKDNGMDVTGFFMFGFDNDTPDIFRKTLNAIYEWKLNDVSFSIVTPYPGTRLFDRLEKENRIVSYNWSNYAEGKVNYKPTHMTEKELIQGIRDIAKDFFSYKSIIRRSFTNNGFNPTKGLITFVGNVSLRSFYRKEKFNI